jgi:uncharacterized protein DUF1963
VSAPSSPEPRFGNRYGCLVVALGIATLAGCLVWAVRRPVVGVPALIAAVAAAAWLMRHATRREREEGRREVARLKAIAAPNGDAWRALLEAEGLGTHAEYLSTGGTEHRHKLLGFADTIQGPMDLEVELVTNGIYCGDPKGYADPRAKELEKNQKQWRLLFQLDSDEAATMMWGDLGRLYFWIREGDLQEQRFDRTWTILQSH